MLAQAAQKQMREVLADAAPGLEDNTERGADIGGCGVEDKVLAEFPTELLERPEGPPFTAVDILELHLAMLEPDWFDDISCCDLDAQR